MKIDRLLISSSMLTAMCEKANVDNLKLLEPFVLVCLSEAVEAGEQVPKEKILEMLDQRFAFQAMPTAVLDKILTRVASGNEKIVQQLHSRNGEGRQFALVKKPLEQVASFFAQEERAKQDTETVITALVAWLQANGLSRTLSSEDVKKQLGGFFETNGFDILFELGELQGATIGNTDATNYQIGRFILDAQENNPDLFKKIVAIAQGMMLASAIYVDTSPVSKHVAQRRLADVNVFLDTTFLLYALGFKTAVQKHAADALLELLKNNGAHLYVFQQHYSEILDILNAFKDRDAYSTKNSQSLETLEDEEYTSLEIDREIRNLEHSLENIGVLIAPEIKYTDTSGKLFPNKNAYIDYSGLKNHLIKKIPQYGKHPAMLENDVAAISSIMIKRAGIPYSEIESCEAIFVTTNYRLVRESNQFLRYPVYTSHIPPVISDMDITTILWVKYAMTTRKDIPQLRLVEHARAALAPSASVMDAFNTITRRMIKNGLLTEDEAANLRYGAYARAEIAAICGGDATVLDDTSIFAIRDRLKGQYAAQEKARADEAIAIAAQARRVASEAKEQVKSKSKELDTIEIKIKQAAMKLRKDAEIKAKKKAAFGGHVIQILVICLILFAMAIVGWATAKVGLSSSLGLAGVIALLSAIVGAVLMWLPAFKLSKRLYAVFYRMLFDKIYCRELKKLQPQIDSITSVLGTSKSD